MKKIKLTDKRVQILLNILIWGAVFALPYLIDTSRSHPRHLPSAHDETEFFWLNFCSFFFWIASFYLNIHVLMPRFFKPKKYGLYALSLLATLAMVMFLHSLLFRVFITTVPFVFLNSLRFLFPAFLLTIAVSVAYKVTVEKNRADNLQMQKNQENLKSELAFLRSQISPHFILNVLNNIVALNRLKSTELEPTLMKLSGLMQYMLYETDEEKVLLKTEVEYLQSYIELQQQRFGSKVKVTLDISLANEWSEIEPMLLIPFVENAFKHGIGMVENPEINIAFISTPQNELLFRVRNKYNPASTQIEDKTSGIGLVNVKRRLNILYGNRQKLEISTNHKIFEVSLSIKLSP